MGLRRLLATSWAIVILSMPTMALGGVGSIGVQPASSAACPPCETLFGKLEPSEGGKYVQHVEVSERGEPKSRTAFIMERVAGMLFDVCDYLKELYGNESCVVNVSYSGDLKSISMTFQPGQDGGGGQCTCSNIERVYISVNANEKHLLPVLETCEYWRPPKGIVFTKPECHFADGSVPTDHTGWQRCMEEAACDLTDDRYQMAVFRDPRAVVVSTFYLFMRHTNLHQPWNTVDEFAVKMFPVTCHWMLVRFILFDVMMAGDGRSISVWTGEALKDSDVWHQQIMDFIGLRLPDDRVHAIAEASSRHDVKFKTKGIEEHIGGALATPNRTYLDEISAETSARLDEMMLKWIPPVLLAKLGVSELAA